MNDINFNCPQCGQHLAVEATAGGATVACPKCGQVIIVPSLARIVATPKKLKRTLWPWIAAAGAICLLLAGGAMIWQMHKWMQKQMIVKMSSGSSTAQATTAPKSPDAAGKSKNVLLPNAPARLSDWFVVLDGINGFYASPEIPKAAIAALEDAQKNGYENRSFSFSPAGDWLLLHNQGFVASDDGLNMCKKLREMYAEEKVNCVAFTPLTGGWTICTDRGVWGPGNHIAPQGAWKEFSKLRQDRRPLRSISYGQDGSWVVLHDATGTSYGDIPPNLAVVLDIAASNNIAIQCVAFSGQDWICLARHDWWTSNTNLPAAKLIAQDFKIGRHPKWVAFVPKPGSFDAHRFEAAVRQSMAGKLAGGYVCEAIDHGTIVAAFAGGWARAPWEKVDPAIKMTVDKPIIIASCSKTITAAALLKLWEECNGTSRQFSLDEPFWPHLAGICPVVNDEVKTITMRNLLMHRTGLTQEFGNNPDALRKLLALPLPYKPGTIGKYQGINYYILRLLIEQISQTDYSTYVKSHVLAPMGITDMDTHSERANSRVCCYATPGRQISGDEGYVDQSHGAGPGGWYGSAADLGRFLEGIRNCKVLSRATTAMMFEDNMGWDVGDPWIKGGLHTGPHDGRVHSEILYDPQGMDIIMLINCEPANPVISAREAWMAGLGGNVPFGKLPILNEAAPSADSVEQLKKLKELYNQGLINADDYDKKVKDILDSL